MRLRNEEERYAAALITPSMIVVFGVIIVPIVTTLVYSFVNINPLSSHKGEFAGFSFYIKTLSSKTFWDDFGRTLYFTVASTAIETVFGLLIALLLNQKFPGVGLLRSIIIIPWAIPTVVNGSLWKLMLNGEYGVINALLERFHLISSYQSWLGNPKTAMMCIVKGRRSKSVPEFSGDYTSCSKTDYYGHCGHAYGRKVQGVRYLLSDDARRPGKFNENPDV